MGTIEDVARLVEFWTADITYGILLAIIKDGAKEMSFEEFLSHCTACGGNWGGMLLTGIKKLFPHVWEAIPDNMGCFAWEGICTTLSLCGVKCNEDKHA